MLKFPPATNHLVASAHGNGIAIIKLLCSYYVNEAESGSGISISVEFKDESCIDRLWMTVTLNVDQTEINDIIEVMIELPTGFHFDKELINFPSFILVKFFN